MTICVVVATGQKHKSKNVDTCRNPEELQGIAGNLKEFLGFPGIPVLVITKKLLSIKHQDKQLVPQRA